MSLLGSIGKAFAGGLVDDIAGVVDRFVETPEERRQFILQVQEIITRRIESADRLEAERMKMVADVVKAEMQSGDTYTKRTRPMIARWGLYVIVANYVALPAIGSLVTAVSGALLEMGPFDLPAEFWWSWGGVVAVWSAGRSGERMAKANTTLARMSGLITGSGPAPDTAEVLR